MAIENTVSSDFDRVRRLLRAFSIAAYPVQYHFIEVLPPCELKTIYVEYLAQEICI